MKKSQSGFSSLVIVLVIIFAAIVSTAGLYVYQNKDITIYENLGTGMEPTISNGETVKADSSITPKRNDVIVFNKKLGPSSEIQIKRLVGLPGDIVKLEDGVLTIISGKDAYTPYEGNVLGENKETSLNENEMYVVGDNISNSLDSRFYGPILSSDVIGVVIE